MDKHALQSDLRAVFEKHGAAVAVGLTRHGVALRSQDNRVDAVNIGIVRAYGPTLPATTTKGA